MRTVGTKVRGIRTPIIQEGDDITQIVLDSLLQSAKTEGFDLYDKDVVGVTESVVARAQGNYVSLEEITKDVSALFPGDNLGVVFPILSRNRFAAILKAIAYTKKKITLLLSYPKDEVGNPLMDEEQLEDLGMNPYETVFTEDAYRELFRDKVLHPFTGIDYVKLYKEISPYGNMNILLANDPRVILNHTDQVLVADIHTREKTSRILKKAGCSTLLTLADICNAQRTSKAYNPQYGLLGSNKAGEDKIKLFPRDGYRYVTEIQAKLKAHTGKDMEVLIFGDGAFKCPVTKIWELADPVVAPAYTPFLAQTPHELKLKYLADQTKETSKDAVTRSIKNQIGTKSKDTALELSLGTTPRQITDLLGSLCDLTTGSGDKGTPVVLIQGYFDDFSKE